MALPINIEEFDEYIRQGEPDKKEKAYIWQTAIGLQAVDGLSTSEYLKEAAKRNIEGEITVDEVSQLVKSYYQSKTSLLQDMFLCIGESLRVYSSMLARYVTMTSPRKNGC